MRWYRRWCGTVEYEVLPETTLAYHGVASGGRKGLRSKVSVVVCVNLIQKETTVHRGKLRRRYHEGLYVLMASTAVHAVSDTDSLD